MKRSGFIVSCKVTVHEFRLLIEEFGDFINLFPFNVPEEILAGFEAMGDTLDSSHCSIFSKVIFK